MAMRLTLFLLIQICSCIELPLIILDYTGTICRQASGNPFKVMPTSTLAYIAHDAMYRSDNVLVFVEEEFGVEDIASRDVLGNAYPNIHKMFIEQNAKYISRVTDPYSTLDQILPSNTSSRIILKDNRELWLNKAIKFHFIHFMEPENYLSETRVERLRRHDDIIKHTYKSMMATRSGLVVVFYTGKSKPKKSARVYHHLKPSPSDVSMMITDQALIRLTGVKLQQGTKRVPLVMPSAATRRSTLQSSSTGVLYDEDLELDFNFEYQKDGWLLESIVLMEGGEEVGRKVMDVGAPYGYSYFCSEPLYIVNTRDKSYITISKYQVEPQPINRLRNLMLIEEYADMTAAQIAAVINKAMTDALKSMNSSSPAVLKEKFAQIVNSINQTFGHAATVAILKDLKLMFTDAVTCGTNFNCHILAGLFVAFIVISIASSGIMVLFDCKSNDRLDDPNQKPLVIVAQM